MIKQQISLAKLRRMTIGFIASVLVAYITASAAQSLFVLAALEQIGAEIPAAIRMQVVWHDFYGLTFGGNVSFGQVILIGFVIAMPVSALVYKYLKVSGFIVYPLAGAVVLATILYVAKTNFYELTLFSGTRSTFGYLSQLLAGAFGGIVFAWILNKRHE